MKNYLFILRHPAHSGSHTQEMLDLILTTAAFDQQVSVLLIDDAVFALKNNQQAEKYHYKETGVIFKALEIYDVNRVYIEIESLQERGLTKEDLLLPVQLIQRRSVSQLLKEADIILSH